MAVKSFEKHMFFFAYLVLFVVSFAISYLFLVHQQQGMLLFGPNRGDAAGYILSSRNLVPAMMGGIRTYAYPLFLKLIRYPYTISVLEMQLFSMYILVIQYTLYAASVSFFAFSITKDRTIRLIIVAALLLQINTLSYLSVTLTETLSLSALLVSCAIFFGIKQGVWRAFLLGLLTAFSVEIRPANLWVYGFILISFLLEFSDYKNNKVEFLKQLAFFAVGSLISFMPQLYWNWTFFHAITPLPA